MPTNRRIYDATTGRRLRSFSGPWGGQLALAATGDFAKVASQTGENEITVWDAHTGAKLITMTCPNQSAALAFSPDGSRLVALSIEGAISVFDTVAGRQVAALRESEASSVREWIVASHEPATNNDGVSYIPAVQFSSDGMRIVLTAFPRDQLEVRVRITTWNGAPVAKKPN